MVLGNGNGPQIVRVRDWPQAAAGWPLLEERLFRAPVEDTDPAALARFVRNTLQQAPARLGFWVALVAAPPYCIGHLLAWIDTWFGAPFVLVFHVALDPGYTLDRARRAQVVQELLAWVQAVNRVLPVPVRELKFLTMRGSPAWQRYLRRSLTLRGTRQLLTFTLGPGPGAEVFSG